MCVTLPKTQERRLESETSPPDEMMKKKRIFAKKFKNLTAFRTFCVPEDATVNLMDPKYFCMSGCFQKQMVLY